MLVIEDFNELVGLETLFRRLGFDVLSLGRASHVTDALLGFPPDLVIAAGRGRHVDGLTLAPKLKYGNHQQPRLVVLMPPRSANEGEDTRDPLSYADVDAIIETPFDPKAALRIVARLLSVDEEPLFEKYAKIVSAQLFEPNALKIIKHPVQPTPLIHVTKAEEFERPAVPVPPPKPVLSARESRYAKFLEDKAEEELPPLASADVLRNARKALEAADENLPIAEVEKAAILAREKREFVRAMIETSQAPPEPIDEEES